MLPRKKRYREYLQPSKRVEVPISTLERVNKNTANTSSSSPNIVTPPVNDFVNYDSEEPSSSDDESEENKSPSQHTTRDQQYSTTSPLSSSDEDDSLFLNDPQPDDLLSCATEPNGSKYEHLNINVNNTSFSVFEILLMIIVFSFRHNLTSTAISDLVNLINRIIGVDTLPNSKYMLSKIFGSNISFEIHVYCPKCTSYLGKKIESAGPCTTLQCTVCNEDVAIAKSDSGKPNFFLSISIKDQLKQLFENLDIQTKLKHRFQRQLGVIADIFDGLSYKKLSSKGEILSNPDNVSITFNADGAPVFKSNKYSIWPIQFFCNELPAVDRFLPENIMLGGLWFGESEPIMHLFLKPFVEQAVSLIREGVCWTNLSGQVVCSKVVTLCCCLDSVAKPMIQCIKQFNGYFGCSYCKHPGELVEGSQVRYTVKNGVVENEYRSDKGIRQDMLQAFDTNNTINGVKTISPLFIIPHFDLVFGFTLDYMHACLLGVTRTMANLWLDSSNHANPYYIGLRVPEINKRLLGIKPPSTITRHPRSISDRTHWKANEWRNWLMFYSIPCLNRILPNQYLLHFGLLVTSVYTLLQEEITYEEVDKANAMLLQFVGSFQDLYGPLCMTINVHLLTHLGKFVSLWGPLWAYSAFSFESGNGSLLKLIKGTRGISTQILSKYLQSRSIPKIMQTYNVQDIVINYCNNLMSYSKIKHSNKKNSVTLLGKEVVIPLSNEECAALVHYGLNVMVKEVYYRMVYKGIKYHCLFYKKPNKTNDCVASLVTGGFVLIVRILIANEEILLMTRKVNVTNRNILSNSRSAPRPHVCICAEDTFGHLNVIPISSLKGKCVFMDIYGVGRFVTYFPNTIEKD